MGNNSAFSNFEGIVILIYNRGFLDLTLLQDIAKEFSNQDADSGGYSGMLSNDGKDLLQIVAELSGKEPATKSIEDDNEAYWDSIWNIFQETVNLN
jgi:hypothetical protein